MNEIYSFISTLSLSFLRISLTERFMNSLEDERSVGRKGLGHRRHRGLCVFFLSFPIKDSKPAGFMTHGFIDFSFELWHIRVRLGDDDDLTLSLCRSEMLFRGCHPNKS